jgi:hypothetical protein
MHLLYIPCYHEKPKEIIFHLENTLKDSKFRVALIRLIQRFLFYELTVLQIVHF